VEFVSIREHRLDAGPISFAIPDNAHNRVTCRVWSFSSSAFRSDLLISANRYLQRTPKQNPRGVDQLALGAPSRGVRRPFCPLPAGASPPSTASSGGYDAMPCLAGRSSRCEAFSGDVRGGGHSPDLDHPRWGGSAVWRRPHGAREHLTIS
jgi:hypothetical protein